MKFYQVISKFYDYGMTTANSFIVYADKKPENTFESLPKYDKYIDYFDNAQKAENYRQQVLSENRKTVTDI